MNSKASITPRSMAGRISPPGTCTTEAPIAWKRSVARPTVRYLRPLMSSGDCGAFLNQPSGWVGIGMWKKLTVLSPRISWVSSRCSSLPPPKWIQATVWCAVQPQHGPVPKNDAPLCLPYQ